MGSALAYHLTSSGLKWSWVGFSIPSKAFGDKMGVGFCLASHDFRVKRGRLDRGYPPDQEYI